LESCGKNDGNKKVSSGREGTEKEMVDSKMELTGKVEGIYSGKEQETFKKEGK